MDRRNQAAVSAPTPTDRPRAANRRAPATRRGRLTRDKLLVAARAVFATKPLSDARVTDITKSAGVASGTFYTYFDSKEEIFREIAAQVLQEMSEASRGGPEEAAFDPAERVERATRRYFECVRKNARVARSIEESWGRESGVGRVRRATLIHGVKRIEHLSVKLQQSGVCDPGIDPWATALALHAMNVSVAYDHLVHRDAPEETDALVEATRRIWCSTLGFDD
jgi:AcrR family transcriptional regulator